MKEREEKKERERFFNNMMTISLSIGPKKHNAKKHVKYLHISQGKYVVYFYNFNHFTHFTTQSNRIAL